MQRKQGIVITLGGLLVAAAAWAWIATASHDAPMVRWETGDELPLRADEVPPDSAVRRAARPTSERLPVRIEADPGRGSRPEVRITGRVVDASARPVGAATVVLEIRRGSTGAARGAGDRSRIAKRLRTEANGRFVFVGPGFRTLSLTLHVSHERHAAGIFDHDAREGLSEVDVGDIALRAGGLVNGRVTNLQDVAIPNATVQLVPDGRNRFTWVRDREELLPSALSDASGMFRLQHAPPGRYRVEAYATGHEKKLSDVFLIADGTAIDLDPVRLGRGYRLAGSVLSPAGAGIAAAEVSLHRGAQTRTDAQGLFHFDHVADRPVRVHVAADGFVSHTTDSIAPAELANVVIRLRTGLTISGVVLDSATGVAVPRYAARARRVGGLRGRSVDGQPRRESEPGPQRRPQRNSDKPVGVVLPRPEGRFSFSGLDQGVFVVDIESPAHQPCTSDPIELDIARTPPQLTLLLEPGLRIDGVVLGPDRAPIGNALVELNAVSPRGAAGGGELRHVRVRSSRTDNRGHFSFGQIAPGHYAVSARAPGYTVRATEPFELRRDIGALTLSLGGLATLQGRIQGIPAGARGVRVLAFGGPARIREVAATAEGRYRLENLQPGGYTVSAFTGEKRAVLARELRRYYADDRFSHFDVVLADGDEKTFDPVFSIPPTGQVVGTITQNGTPGAGLSVSLRAGTGTANDSDPRADRFLAQTRTGARGGFRFDEVPEGQYILEVRSAPRVSRPLFSAAVFVQRDRPTERAVELVTANIRGTITPGEGSATDLHGRIQLFRGAARRPDDIDAFAAENEMHEVAVRSGSFAASNLSVGPYWLVLQLAGREAVEQPVTLASGDNRITLATGARNSR